VQLGRGGRLEEVKATRWQCLTLTCTCTAHVQYSTEHYLLWCDVENLRVASVPPSFAGPTLGPRTRPEHPRPMATPGY
jgi:hypothetical protein